MPTDPTDLTANGDEPLAPATEEALARLVHLHSGTATSQDRADYETWKVADPGHEAAAAQAERLWTMLGPALAGRKARRSRRTPVIVAAATALGGLAFASGIFGGPASYFADMRTGIGERRTVMLADGSRIDLDTGTSFDVAEGGRRLTLYTGQIFVTVAHDTSRPFRVASGDGTIEAVGTAFDVRRSDGATTVVVTENAVRISHPSPAGKPAIVTVTAGQEVDFTPGAGLSTGRPASLADRIAWRQGQLRFSDRPLGEVLDELGRYRRGVTLVTDDTLRRLPVTGIFDVENPDSLLDAVTVALPVKILRLPWLTIVQRDPARTFRPAERR